MVEVFKTNVNNPADANLLIDRIHKTFMDYEANFDLHDRDNILRVKCTTGAVQASLLINLLNDFGFLAEVLEDNHPSANILLNRLGSYIQMN